MSRMSRQSLDQEVDQQVEQAEVDQGDWDDVLPISLDLLPEAVLGPPDLASGVGPVVVRVTITRHPRDTASLSHAGCPASAAL